MATARRRGESSSAAALRQLAAWRAPGPTRRRAASGERGGGLLAVGVGVGAGLGRAGAADPRRCGSSSSSLHRLHRLARPNTAPYLTWPDVAAAASPPRWRDSAPGSRHATDLEPPTGPAGLTGPVGRALGGPWAGLGGPWRACWLLACWGRAAPGWRCPGAAVADVAACNPRHGRSRREAQRRWRRRDAGDVVDVGASSTSRTSSTSRLPARGQPVVSPLPVRCQPVVSPLPAVLPPEAAARGSRPGSSAPSRPRLSSLAPPRLAAPCAPPDTRRLGASRPCDVTRDFAVSLRLDMLKTVSKTMALSHAVAASHVAPTLRAAPCARPPHADLRDGPTRSSGGLAPSPRQTGLAAVFVGVVTLVTLVTLAERGDDAGKLVRHAYASAGRVCAPLSIRPDRRCDLRVLHVACERLR